MRITLSCLLSLLPLAAGAAKPPKMDATLACATADGVALPAKARPKLTGPVTCALTLRSDGTYMSTIVTKTPGKNGPDHSGDLLKDQPLKAALAPGTDFAPCTDFEIEARIETDTSSLLWKKTLAVKQDCKVKKIKAELKCSMERDGKEVALPAKGNPRLESPIHCLIVTTDEACLKTKALLKVAEQDKPAVAKTAGFAADNGKYLYEFTLAPDADFTACSPPLTLTGELIDENGGAAFSKAITLKQSCPD